MPEEKKTIHVSPVGEHWEVEDNKATLGQAETQPAAIELATELATESRAEEIQVHASDGALAERIPVDHAADAQEAEDASLGRHHGTPK